MFPSDVDLDHVRSGLGSLRDEPTSAAAVVDELADAVEPALVATTGPRYFGFVVGGALDAATAADVFTAGWDQPAFDAVTSPAAAVVEDVTGGWLKELLGLPARASFGFVTGAQAANTVSLAAARHVVLAEAGWDVEQHGLIGAPSVRVVANGERHATIDRSLRLLGLGAGVLEPVATDAQGAIDVTDLGRVLARRPAGPTIVCLQAGNVWTETLRRVRLVRPDADPSALEKDLKSLRKMRYKRKEAEALAAELMALAPAGDFTPKPRRPGRRRRGPLFRRSVSTAAASTVMASDMVIRLDDATDEKSQGTSSNHRARRVPTPMEAKAPQVRYRLAGVPQAHRSILRPALHQRRSGLPSPVVASRPVIRGDAGEPPAAGPSGNPRRRATGRRRRCHRDRPGSAPPGRADRKPAGRRMPGRPGA